MSYIIVCLLLLYLPYTCYAEILIWGLQQLHLCVQLVLEIFNIFIIIIIIQALIIIGESVVVFCQLINNISFTECIKPSFII
jgi:hypothetical protein